MIKRLATIASVWLFLNSAPGMAAPDADMTETKNSAWVFGLNGVQYNLRANNGSNLIGTSAAVRLGYSYLGHTWWTMGSVDILSGPYKSAQALKPKLDFTGTGFSWALGWAPWVDTLRDEKIHVGVQLGLNYADIIGRSTEEGPEDALGNSTDHMTMRVTNFQAVPSLFMSWFAKPRFKGNRPDQLITRIEGYVVAFGIAQPFIASYQLNYEVIDAQNSTTLRSENGNLKGKTYLLTLTSYLGA